MPGELNFSAVSVSRFDEIKKWIQSIKQLVERIVEADSAMLITTYERQIKQLEEKRIVLDEKIAKCVSVNDRLLKINRTFLGFLRKPHEYWDSNDLRVARTVLKRHLHGRWPIAKRKGIELPLSRSHSRF